MGKTKPVFLGLIGNQQKPAGEPRLSVMMVIAAGTLHGLNELSLNSTKEFEHGTRFRSLALPPPVRSCTRNHALRSGCMKRSGIHGYT